MELGDRVIYYTHESSEADHTVRDQLAFVVGIVDEEALDVVVFPPGGPVRFERVWPFDADEPYLRAGGSYWREPGSEPPDFSEAFLYHNHPRWIEMDRRQTEEQMRIPSENQEQMFERHLEERNQLRAALEKASPRDKGEPK